LKVEVRGACIFAVSKAVEAELIKKEQRADG
jgi:hypothetical protein